MQAGHQVWTRREAKALRIERNRNHDLVVIQETLTVPRRTPGIFQGTVEALMLADNTLAPVTLMGVRYRVDKEVVFGWYDQEQFDRVVESL
jgi:hypothetical protein